MITDRSSKVNSNPFEYAIEYTGAGPKDRIVKIQVGSAPESSVEVSQVPPLGKARLPNEVTERLQCTQLEPDK